MKSKRNREKIRRFFKEAQAMIEYLLLLGATVVVVLLAFKGLLPFTRDASNAYFNKVAIGVMGEMADQIQNADGNWHKARSYTVAYP